MATNEAVQAVLVELEAKPPSTADQIAAAITEALIAAELKKTPLPEMADQLAKDKPELVAAWAKDQLVKEMAHRKRTLAPRVAEQEQLPLPGFERLPEKLSIAGRRLRRWDARYKDVRKWLSGERKKNSALVEAGKAWVELMRRYAEERGPDITYREAHRLEMERLQDPAERQRKPKRAKRKA